MSSDKPKEPPYRDAFYEDRAKRLTLLNNSAKMCKRSFLNPTVEQLQEAIQIGYELLEELHRNNVQERLADLLEKATALIERNKEDGE